MFAAVGRRKILIFLCGRRPQKIVFGTYKCFVAAEGRLKSNIWRPQAAKFLKSKPQDAEGLTK